MSVTVYVHHVYMHLADIVFITHVSGRDEKSHHVDSHMMVPLMRVACTQQAGNHFQPQSPVCAPQMMHPTMMMDDLMVRYILLNL